MTDVERDPRPSLSGHPNWPDKPWVHVERQGSEDIAEKPTQVYTVLGALPGISLRRRELMDEEDREFARLRDGGERSGYS